LRRPLRIRPARIQTSETGGCGHGQRCIDPVEEAGIQAPELKELYGPRAGHPAIVDVPDLSFLMVDGMRDPNTARDYKEAVEALFAVSYRVKFAVKRGANRIDYGAMPLERLWWVDDMSTFSLDDKSGWSWTAMIMQPDVVTEELVQQSILEASKKKPLPAATRLRFDRFGEGLAAQVLYTGPYSAEGPTIERFHGFIADARYRSRGTHHEIYLSDPSRAEPAKLRTIIRKPVATAP
jgi:hypothetical protein